MYPVDVKYEPAPVRDYTEAAAKWVQEIVASGGRGDILIFMPGEEAIRHTIKKIEELGVRDVELLSLFGAMAPEDQDKIFTPSQKRKVIVSTNIAHILLRTAT